MDILVLNTSFQAVGVVDVYKSLIWADRYSGYGDFEIHLTPTAAALELYKEDYYLVSPQSDHVMIIEVVNIITDTEDGPLLIVSGTSLENLISRRIVWGQMNISGNLQLGVRQLLYDNLIAPVISARQMSNFTYLASTNPLVTSPTAEGQYTGDNLYDVVKDICDEQEIGFRVRMPSDGVFQFNLYAGADRSYEQETNPYVVFSPNFDNLVKSEYIASKATLRNVALVAGEGEGSLRSYQNAYAAGYSGEGPSGLIRRELFVDARDISSNNGGIAASLYQQMLYRRGMEKLAENKVTKTFDGQAEPTNMYRYGEDFLMGDIVQIENEYGFTSRSRVVEYIRTYDESEVSAYPTFAAL